MLKKLSLSLLTSGLLAATLSAPAQSKVYMATNWMTPVHILNEYTYQNWVKEVKAATNGSIDFEVHSSGSLVPARSTMQSIRDNVAVVGVVFPGYTPSEQPLSNVLIDLAFVADDDYAAAFAFSEIGMTNPLMIAEWKKNGGVFAGGYATPVYNYACVKPIRTAADVKGLKIRTAGGAQTQWTQQLGAVPVSVPIADVYSGLERGSIDCTMTDPTNLDKGNKFWEVAKSVTLLPMGVVLGANYVYNTRFWKDRTNEERRALLDTMAQSTADAQVAYHVGVTNALRGAKERGLEIIEPDQSLKTELASFSQDFIKDLPQSSIATRKVEDPTELITEYLALQEKWKKLLEGVDRNDSKAIGKVLYDNLYSKIDESSFGL